jgi:hypothetical protein
LLQSSIIEVHSSKEQGIIPAPGDVVTAKVMEDRSSNNYLILSDDYS